MKFNYSKLYKLLSLIILNKFVLYLTIHYCTKCINKYDTRCEFCSIKIIFRGLNIAKREETLDEIINNNKSLARFGDGEFNLMFGWGNGFQNKNKLLQRRLINVLNSNLKNLLIGIYIPYLKQDLKYLRRRGIIIPL